MEKEFAGKVVFITGAAHGQGRATALAFAKEGAYIVGYDIARKAEYPDYEFGSDAELQSLKKEVEDHGLKIAGIESVNIHDAIKVGTPDRDQ